MARTGTALFVVLMLACGALSAGRLPGATAPGLATAGPAAAPCRLM